MEKPLNFKVIKAYFCCAYLIEFILIFEIDVGPFKSSWKLIWLLQNICWFFEDINWSWLFKEKHTKDVRTIFVYSLAPSFLLAHFISFQIILM